MRKPMTRQELLKAIANSRQWAEEATDPTQRRRFLQMAQGLEAELSKLPGGDANQPITLAAVRQLVAAIEDLNRPKSIVRDAQGRPVGLVPGNAGAVDPAALQQTLAALGAAISGMNGPKHVVRDAGGRPVGVAPAEVTISRTDEDARALSERAARSSSVPSTIATDR